MMMIKWHEGNGRWRLAEVADNLRFQTGHTVYEVEVRHAATNSPTGVPPPMRDVSLWVIDCSPEQLWLDHADHGLPHWDEIETAIVSEQPDGRAFVRPFSWVAPDGTTRALITDAPVFVLNDKGDTIEVVR